MKKVHIEGMSCGHCTAAVKEALEELEGVTSVEVNLEEKEATIHGDASDDVITRVIEDEGYDVIDIEVL